MVADLELMDLLEDSGLDEDEKRAFIRHVEEEQSAFVPALNTIYLATLSVNHAAEEAAHYVKQRASRAAEPGEPRDRFYFVALNEALAFFGSKVINPKRKAEHQGRLRRAVARARKQKAWNVEDRAARFALEHLTWERSGGRGSALEHAADLADPAVFSAAAHLLGYILGDRMYYALTDGVISKRRIRELFLARHDEPGEALDTYLELSAALRSVKIPRRI